MEAGYASVWHSSVTSWPRYAPSSWFGMDSIGGTAKTIGWIGTLHALHRLHTHTHTYIAHATEHVYWWRGAPRSMPRTDTRPYAGDSLWWFAAFHRPPHSLCTVIFPGENKRNRFYRLGCGGFLDDSRGGGRSSRFVCNQLPCSPAMDISSPSSRRHMTYGSG